MSCPQSARLAAYVAGDLTAEEVASLDAHVARCAECAENKVKLASAARRLGTALAVEPDPSFSARVQARLDAPRRSGVRAWLTPLAALAAAGAVALVLRPEPEFASRGGPADSRPGFDAQIHVEGRPGTGRPLVEGATIAADEGFTFAIHDTRGDAPYFLLFAVDAARDVHWFHPAFPTADADPISPRLPAGAHRFALGEGVTPDHPAPGALRLVGLFSPEPMRARDVEEAIAQGGLDSLATRFPHATRQIVNAQVLP